MTQPLVSFKGIGLAYGQQQILQDFQLDIQQGEFFTILGPSGCGKTTILRLLAGFEQPDQGQILLDGQDLSELPAEKRPINTVFQSYALFPHLTVAQNILFGLKMQGLPKAEQQQRLEEVLQMVQLQGLQDRKPHQLSGGQKQRVAIARAVINRPKVLLLDESLSALDAKLRLQMQLELKTLQRQLGITFVYVTHDQEEALSMSDRILVMHRGQAQQIGTPRDIYESPATLFVAQFIGEINVFDGQVVDTQPQELHYLVQMNDGAQRVIRSDIRLSVGDEIHILLRPEDLRIEYLEDAEGPGFKGEIVERNYKGKTLDSAIRLHNGQIILASEYFNEDDPDFDYRIQQKVWVDWVHGWEHIIRKQG